MSGRADLVFLLACYVLIGDLDHRLSMLGGLVAWPVAALAIFAVPRFL